MLLRCDALRMPVMCFPGQPIFIRVQHYEFQTALSLQQLAAQDTASTAPDYACQSVPQLSASALVIFLYFYFCWCCFFRVCLFYYYSVSPCVTYYYLTLMCCLCLARSARFLSREGLLRDSALRYIKHWYNYIVLLVLFYRAISALQRPYYYIARLGLASVFLRALT